MDVLCFGTKYNSNTIHDHGEILWENVAPYWPVMDNSCENSSIVVTIVVAKQQLRAEKLHPPIFQLLWVEQCIALYLLCNPLYTVEQWTLHFALLHFCTFVFSAIQIQCNSELQHHSARSVQCKHLLQSSDRWDFSARCSALWCYLTLGMVFKPRIQPETLTPIFCTKTNTIRAGYQNGSRGVKCSSPTTFKGIFLQLSRGEQ